jgi:hypothetical protein
VSAASWWSGRRGSRDENCAGLRDVSTVWCGPRGQRRGWEREARQSSASVTRSGTLTPWGADIQTEPLDWEFVSTSTCYRGASAAPTAEATPVLPRLVCLTLCRSIQLLALLTRGDAAKDLKILVLRHQLIVLRLWVPDIRCASCDLRVLMDQPTEPISPRDPPSRHDDS